MKRFHFRLERVLKLKQQRERLAELRQQQARQLVEVARAEVVRLTDLLSQTAATLRGKATGAVPAGMWIAHYTHSAQLGQSLELAVTRVQRAEQVLRDAAAQRTKIAQEVEALLHLRGQEWQEHSGLVLREEQVRLDEVSMRLWKAVPLAGASAEPFQERGEGP